MGLLGSPIGNVACRPVTRNSSLETSGWAGSGRTGPGPLAGGMNWREYANHPTPGLGAKSGGEAPAASAETLQQRAPARTPAVKVPAGPDIGFPSSANPLVTSERFAR